VETIPVNDLTLYFDPSEHEAAELVRRACDKSVQLIHACWDLDPPADLRVYVLTSDWLQSTFHSAPWGWRILMSVTLPLWYLRTARLWQVAGGWHQQYGQRQVVGVKTPRLLSRSDHGLGDRVFVREEDVADKIQHITCHELVHAFTAHLKLPVWLNEGLALLTVDRLFDRPTIKCETVEVLRHAPGKTNDSRRLDLKNPDAVVYLYVRGYWLTRYLEETRPGLLQGLLVRHYSHNELESRIAFAYGREQQAFWREADDTVAAHFVSRPYGTCLDKAVSSCEENIPVLG